MTIILIVLKKTQTTRFLTGQPNTDHYIDSKHFFHESNMYLVSKCLRRKTKPNDKQAIHNVGSEFSTIQVPVMITDNLTGTTNVDLNLSFRFSMCAHCFSQALLQGQNVYHRAKQRLTTRCTVQTWPGASMTAFWPQAPNLCCLDHGVQPLDDLLVTSLWKQNTSFVMKQHLHLTGWAIT